VIECNGIEAQDATEKRGNEQGPTSIATEKASKTQGRRGKQFTNPGAGGAPGKPFNQKNWAAAARQMRKTPYTNLLR